LQKTKQENQQERRLRFASVCIRSRHRCSSSSSLICTVASY
jgi:hypothetical protein